MALCDESISIISTTNQASEFLHLNGAQVRLDFLETTLKRLLDKIRTNPSICAFEKRVIYILNEEHSHTDTLLRWRGSILLVKPSKGLIRSTFNKAAKKKQHNLFGLLHSTFNFLPSLICSCRHLSIFNPLPSLLSLKGTFIEMLSRTSSHTRPDYNRPTYLPGSFIYLLPPPSLLALD